MRGHSCFYCGSRGQGDETREGDTVTDRQGGWVVNSKKRSLQSWTAAFQGVGCTDSHTPTSGRLRPLVKGGQSCTPSLADPTSTPFTIVPPVSTSRSVYLKCTASAWEEVNLDLGASLGWELKGSPVEPKSVVSTLVLSV